MDERGVLVRAVARVVTTLKWVIYCGSIAVVGGGVVFVLTAVWLGLPVGEIVGEIPVFGSISPSMVAVGVLLAACVVVLDADLQSR